MKSRNTKSSNELQREVHKEIRNVKRDLDELHGRLSPGQIIDDAIFYPHGKSLRSTLEHLKRNPVGTTFLSLGTILLMEDEAHKTYEEKTKAQLILKKESLSSKATSLKQVKRVASDINDKFHSRKEELQENVSRGFSHRKDKISQTYQTSKETLQNMDPSLAIVLGAGLGALTGASLPISEQEESFIDDKLGDKFSHLAQDLKDAINESSDILKDLVINDVKEMSFKVFK